MRPKLTIITHTLYPRFHEGQKIHPASLPDPRLCKRCGNYPTLHYVVGPYKFVRRYAMRCICLIKWMHAPTRRAMILKWNKRRGVRYTLPETIEVTPKKGSRYKRTVHRRANPNPGRRLIN